MYKQKVDNMTSTEREGTAKGFVLGGFAKRLLLCFMPILLMIIIRILKLNDEADVKVIMRLMLTAVAVLAAFWFYRGKPTAERTVTLIIIVGIILRWGYTMYTGPFVRAHDIGATDETGTGHYAYLRYVVEGHLPPTNTWQFYQPPLFYILSAIFIRIGMFLTNEADWSKLLYAAQMVSCVSSCLTLAVTAEILEKFKLKGRVQAIIIALIAVYPSQILCSSRLNNDMLSFMFMIFALYFTLMWHKDRRLKYIIGIALSIGFGMMTKINCGLIALLTGPVMLYHLFRTCRSKDYAQLKSLIIQLAVFAVICFPLGLVYAIRNYVLFGQPLTYVLDLGKNIIVYTGDASFSERWLHIPFLQMLKNPYVSIGKETNIFGILIKTGVHGEFKYDGMSSFLAWGLDYVHTAILLLTLISVTAVMFGYKTMDKSLKRSAFWVWLIMTVSYIQFNVSYPYSCTADFRYMLLWQAASAVFIASFADYCKTRENKKLFRVSLVVTAVIIALFCGMSIIHFC